MATRSRTRAAMVRERAQARGLSVNHIFTTEQPLKGRARSELAVKTDSTVPRTPELLACSHNLILYEGSLPELTSRRARADDNTKNTTVGGLGASAGAGAGARLR
eukprot:5500560-Pleurochrysis_carterae.AAC.1